MKRGREGVRAYCCLWLRLKEEGKNRINKRWVIKGA
jgi:hypothetical protein